MEHVKNILILGGYGRTGLEIAKLLLKHTGHSIWLAGRDPIKASHAARELNSRYSGERVRGLEVNVAFKIQLAAALDGYDLVIDAIRETAFGEQIVQAALEADVHYIDLSAGTRRQPHLKKLAAEIQAAGLTFITAAGFAADAPTLMARYLAGYFDAVDALTTDCLLEGKTLNYRNHADLTAIRDNGPMTLDVDPDFGWPFAITLRKMGASCSRIFLRGRRSIPDLGQVIAVKAKATGMMNGSKEELELTLKHRHPHRAAAAAVVPGVAGIFEGSIRQPGVHRMGQALDPEKYMDHIWQMGATVSLKGLPDAWHEKAQPVERPTVEMNTENKRLIEQVA